ncbi:polysaccharide deacetylase family protein [Clostridium sp. UBA6640]|uniref:polysaccharide deacetylase family protein n=1 Tax=Clostridium sp. UBA6640 TaxID=1946370 RepID=UPI0025BAA326|nr:polysaccharide deacetylase family protein [Clostridium sp. UBA6640]
MKKKTYIALIVIVLVITEVFMVSYSIKKDKKINILNQILFQNSNNINTLDAKIYSADIKTEEYRGIENSIDKEIKKIEEQINSLDEMIKIEEKKQIEKKEKQKELISSIQNYSGNKITEYYVANIPNKKVAYLTFDDGPSKNTIEILDTLKKYDIKATFFVNGREDEFSHKVYERMIKEGHTLGNHTYSHDYSYVYSDMNSFIEDFDKLQKLIKSKYNYEMKIARFPGGSNNTISENYHYNIMTDLSKFLIISEYTYFDWNIDSNDATAIASSRDYIINSVLENSKDINSAIILMHDNIMKTTTAEALPYIIDGLINQGYEFSSLDPSQYTIQFLRAVY